MRAQTQNFRQLALLAVLSFAPFVPALASDPIGRLGAGDAANSWSFGDSVDVSGNLTLVGATGAQVGNQYYGAAYLFDHTTETQLHKLEASDPLHLSFFGNSVGIDGNLGIVGCPYDDDNGTKSGSAYVFDLTTGQELWKLLPSDGGANHLFGHDVDISGNTAIIGAPWADHDGAKSGSVYFFDMTNGQEIGRWLRGDGAVDDEFGRSVAIDGFKAVAGAPYDDPVGSNSGSVYVYDLILGLSQGRLSRIDGDDWDSFGFSVGLDSGKAIVGAPTDDPGGVQTGSAYIFDVGTGWQLHKLEAADGINRSYFGISVAIDGNQALVGAHYQSPMGAGYLFDVVSGTEMDKFVDPAAPSHEWFGYAVGLSGSMAVITSQYDDEDAKDAGSAFLFDTCPENIVLTATPALAQQGDTLSLTTFGGDPGQPNILFVIDVNGVPIVSQVTNGVFNNDCTHYFLPTVPAGLAGLDVTMMAVGWKGGFQLSNTVLVEFI